MQVQKLLCSLPAMLVLAGCIPQASPPPGYGAPRAGGTVSRPRQAEPPPRRAESPPPQAKAPPRQVEPLPRRVETRPFPGNAPRGDAMLKRVMLDQHNAARVAVGVMPLTWSDALAADALAYARELARTGRFQHSPQPAKGPPHGENLWTGTRGAYRYDEMVGHWIAEKRNFVNRPAPDFSTTGRYQDAGHYTQIIWSRTTEFGCALASNARNDFLVCRYMPGGNVVGSKALPQKE